MRRFLEGSTTTALVLLLTYIFLTFGLWVAGFIGLLVNDLCALMYEGLTESIIEFSDDERGVLEMSWCALISTLFTALVGSSKEFLFVEKLSLLSLCWAAFATTISLMIYVR